MDACIRFQMQIQMLSDLKMIFLLKVDVHSELFYWRLGVIYTFEFERVRKLRV